MLIPLLNPNLSQDVLDYLERLKKNKKKDRAPIQPRGVFYLTPTLTDPDTDLGDVFGDPSTDDAFGDPATGEAFGEPLP